MHNQRYAFILHIWAEEDATLPQHAWRGSLQAVDGKALRYFDSLPKLITLLTAVTGWNEVSPPPDEPSRSKS